MHRGMQEVQDGVCHVCGVAGDECVANTCKTTKILRVLGESNLCNAEELETVDLIRVAY